MDCLPCRVFLAFLNFVTKLEVEIIFVPWVRLWNIFSRWILVSVQCCWLLTNMRLAARMSGVCCKKSPLCSSKRDSFLPKNAILFLKLSSNSWKKVRISWNKRSCYNMQWRPFRTLNFELCSWLWIRFKNLNLNLDLVVYLKLIRLYEYLAGYSTGSPVLRPTFKYWSRIQMVAWIPD